MGFLGADMLHFGGKKSSVEKVRAGGPCGKKPGHMIVKTPRSTDGSLEENLT